MPPTPQVKKATPTRGATLIKNEMKRNLLQSLYTPAQHLLIYPLQQEEPWWAPSQRVREYLARSTHPWA